MAVCARCDYYWNDVFQSEECVIIFLIMIMLSSTPPLFRVVIIIPLLWLLSQTLKVFEQYPEDILLELSRSALYDTFLANVTRKSIDHYVG